MNMAGMLASWAMTSKQKGCEAPSAMSFANTLEYRSSFGFSAIDLVGSFAGSRMAEVSPQPLHHSSSSIGGPIGLRPQAMLLFEQ